MSITQWASSAANDRFTASTSGGCVTGSGRLHQFNYSTEALQAVYLELDVNALGERGTANDALLGPTSAGSGATTGTPANGSPRRAQTPRRVRSMKSTVAAP